MQYTADRAKKVVGVLYSILLLLFYLAVFQLCVHPGWGIVVWWSGGFPDPGGHLGRLLAMPIPTGYWILLISEKKSKYAKNKTTNPLSFERLAAAKIAGKFTTPLQKLLGKQDIFWAGKGFFSLSIGILLTLGLCPNDKILVEFHYNEFSLV